MPADERHIRMSRLFWKVFLGFWLTTAVIIVATTVVVSMLVERSDVGRFLAREEARLETSAVTAQVLLSQDGPAALRAWLREQNSPGRTPLWLVDDNGRDVLGRHMPPPLRRALRLGSRAVLTANVNAPDGTVFRLVAPPPWPQDRPSGRPGILGIGLPIAIVISGFVCWALARYLARPVYHLQRATRRLAAGELSVRVGPAMGRRRDEIADLGTDFDRMATRLQELLDAQQRLLRDVSHELRTPLARLHVALGLARQRGDGIDAELDRVELEAKRLDELIGELLAVMRLQSGADTPTSQPVKLRPLLSEVVEDAKLEADERPCRLELTAKTSPEIAGDRELLRRAVENVVRNAIRHTAPNTVVTVTLDGPDPAKVTIRDHGPGVPDLDLPTVFEPFFRVESARDRTSGGHGLGLAIAQQAIRAHGGEIVAVNVPDGGLQVEIRLPVAA